MSTDELPFDPEEEPEAEYPEPTPADVDGEEDKAEIPAPRFVEIDVSRMDEEQFKALLQAMEGGPLDLENSPFAEFIRPVTPEMEDELPITPQMWEQIIAETPPDDREYLREIKFFVAGEIVEVQRLSDEEQAAFYEKLYPGISDFHLDKLNTDILDEDEEG